MHAPTRSREFEIRPIKLIYRDNSLYRSLRECLEEILTSLGYRVETLALDEHAHAKGIRAAVRSVLHRESHPWVLPDHTSWQAIANHRDFSHVQFPFGHLDTLGSEAAMKTLFPELEHVPVTRNIEPLFQRTLDAIVKLFALMQEKNPAFAECHIIQTQLGEHFPFVVPLIDQLIAIVAPDSFPPDRRDLRIQAACDVVEESHGLRIRHALESIGVRASIHTTVLPSARDRTVVLCDSHYAKTHPGQLPHGQTLTLPLASAIADAIEHNLIPTDKNTLLGSFGTVIRERHAQLTQEDNIRSDALAYR